MTMKFQNISSKFFLPILVLTVALPLSLVPADSMAQAGQARNDSSENARPEVILPPRLAAIKNREDLVIPKKKKKLFFTPQDENTSCTVIFLFNTKKENLSAQIVTHDTDGNRRIKTTIPVPRKGVVRIVSDTVDTASASWQDAVLVNFTTNSARGRLRLPEGVLAEAYVAWNGGTTFDPLAEVQTLPIRFWEK